MTILEFLAHLHRLKIELWLEEDRLRYKAPAGSLTPELRTQLAERKPEIIAALHAAQEYTPLTGMPLPLSFAQQRLWFLDQLEPASSAYTIPVALRLEGRLHVAILQHSFDALIERHAALRTTFPSVAGQPAQVVAPAQPLTLHQIDLRTWPPADRDAAIERIFAEEANRTFSLQEGPLLWVTLVQLADTTHVLLLNMHHIIADGWSMQLLLRDLVALYRAQGDPDAAGLPSLPMQYADYAVWQRDRLQGTLLDTQLAYWRQQLDELEPLQLPTDRPRPPLPSFHGAAAVFALPADVGEALAKLGQSQGTTIFMTLLAVFQALLARMSGQNDIVVGTPIANRTRGETEGVIGMFVNTLVLRTKLRDQLSFRELLQQVREACLDAYAHQELPFEQIVDLLQAERDLSRHPLFQVMFAVEQASPTSALELPDLRLHEIAVDQPTVKFDLSLTFREDPSALIGWLSYRTDLFTAATMARMVDHLQLLMAAVVASPDQPLHTIPLLTSDEHQCLARWNTTARSYPPAVLVHELIAEWAARRPHATALIWHDQTLTYAELDRRANQLAHMLQRLGVGPEVCVGLYLQRSPDLVVGMLGILKAGGAYVPLDPSYPAERLHFMLSDSQISVLITQQALIATLPQPPAEVICLDTDWTTISHLPLTAPPSHTRPEHLAYLIYTSGTTGQPKAVHIEHRSLFNTLQASLDQFSFDADDIMPWIASVAFDITLFELLLPLLTGGTVQILTQADILDLPALVQAMRRYTRLHTVPSLMRQIVARLRAEEQSINTLRQVFVGGESVPADLVRDMQRVFPQAQITILYGPTEATIICTSYAVPPDQSISGHPIGAPLANVQLRLYDAYVQLVPLGVPGELYVGGAGVARGYLNRPELTAEKFVTIDGQRWYRTGDRARYLPDGTLDFLGRTDRQVKVRGFRIEPGEIESMLRSQPQVRDTVIVARQDSTGAQRLIAYVVLRAEHAPTDTRQIQADLRGFLQHTLPDYMLPAVFVFLESLPLTTNGKIDLRALPMAPEGFAAIDTLAHPPRTDLEIQLVQLWQRLLERDTVGVTDNFFQSGGHSLMTIQLQAQLKQQFGCEIPLTSLFQAPTIEQQAALIQSHAQRLSHPWSPLVPLQRGGARRPFFCVHPGGGTVLCYAQLAQLLGPDQPFYGLQARGLEADQTPHTNIPAMAAEYLQAIREVQPEGPYLLGGWSLGGIIAFEMARQLRQQEQPVGLVALIDSYLPNATLLPDEDALVVAFLHDLAGMLGLPAIVSADALRLVPRENRLSTILAQARDSALVPPDLNQEQLERLLRVFQSNLAALLSYQPAPSHQQIALLQADEHADAIVTRDVIDWRTLVGDNMTRQVIAGTHYTLLRPPAVYSVARWLQDHLTAPQAALL